VIALWHRLPIDFEEQLVAIGRRAEAYHVDDGADDALRAAAGFEDLGLRGVFFVVTGWIDTPGWVTADMLRELVARGHEIGNHSHTHPMMTTIPLPDVRDEIARGQDVLASITGTPPTRFAWPHGRHNRDVDEIAASFGFREMRDIHNVVRRIITKTPDELAEMFP
jgi:peptidoglycan/xylan/chitin deacetylase (PgdA/CDA1 family)